MGNVRIAIDSQEFQLITYHVLLQCVIIDRNWWKMVDANFAPPTQLSVKIKKAAYLFNALFHIVWRLFTMLSMGKVFVFYMIHTFKPDMRNLQTNWTRRHSPKIIGNKCMMKWSYSLSIYNTWRHKSQNNH